MGGTCNIERLTLQCSSVHAFPGDRIRDLGVASTMLNSVNYTNMQFDQNIVWNLKRQATFCNGFCMKSTYKWCLGRQLSSFWNRSQTELLTNVTLRFNRQRLWNIDLVSSASSLNITGPWWFVTVMVEGESPDHF